MTGRERVYRVDDSAISAIASKLLHSSERIHAWLRMGGWVQG